MKATELRIGNYIGFWLDESCYDAVITMITPFHCETDFILL